MLTLFVCARVCAFVCFVSDIRCCVRILVYTLLALGLLGSLALSVVTYTEWRDLKDELNATPSDQRLDTDERNERVLYGMMIFLFVFTGLLWLITLALRNRIRLSVVILEQASKAVARMPWVSRPLSHLSHSCA